MHSVRKPWWQQATALVTVTTGGVITGFNFVPGAAATMTSPTSVPLHLLALEQAAQPGAALNARAVGGDSADSGTGDALLRSAIVNVAKYYLQIAATRSPAQMEALIWDNTSLNGADHGPSCAAFASLTLELAAQAVGQQSWVSGGTSYPFPLPAWADVRVDTNPASPAVTSVMADAQAHGRWHPVERRLPAAAGRLGPVRAPRRGRHPLLRRGARHHRRGLRPRPHGQRALLRRLAGGGRRGRLRRQRAPRHGLARRRERSADGTHGDGHSGARPRPARSTATPSPSTRTGAPCLGWPGRPASTARASPVSPVGEPSARRPRGRGRDPRRDCRPQLPPLHEPRGMRRRPATAAVIRRRAGAGAPPRLGTQPQRRGSRRPRGHPGAPATPRPRRGRSAEPGRRDRSPSHADRCPTAVAAAGHPPTPRRSPTPSATAERRRPTAVALAPPLPPLRTTSSTLRPRRRPRGRGRSRRSSASSRRGRSPPSSGGGCPRR